MLSNLFQILTILLVSLGPVWALTTTKSSTRAATKTTATARATATTDFWWSFPPGENYTEDNPYGYDPLFEICGPSCEECRENAKQCRSDQFSNICYEPADGETCCNDVYGTACIEDYYCAYNNESIAFCCAKDEKIQDCGALFDETLSASTRVAPTTVVVTQVFAPTGTATTDSRVARPNRTPLVKLPSAGSVDVKTGSRKKVGGGLTTGAIVGIAAGAFILVFAIGAALAFFFIRKRGVKKYAEIGKDGAFPVAGSAAYPPSAQEQKQPFLAVSQQAAPPPAYQDHPALREPHGVELADMPAHQTEARI